MKRSTKWLLNGILLGVICLNTIAFGQWVHVGDQGFSEGKVSHLKLTFNEATPYVAYKDWENEYRASVMKYNGASWEYVGPRGFSNEVGTFLDMAIVNGVPHVVYMDMDNSQHPTVAKFNGTIWENLPPPSNAVAYDLNLIEDNGELFFGFKDFSVGTRATLKKFNGTTWETIGAPGFSSPGFWFDFNIHDGVPYVAYKEGYMGNYKATAMRFNGTEWELIGNDQFSPGQVAFTQIEVFDGQPHVAFADYSQGNKVLVMKFDGTNWVPISANMDELYAGDIDMKSFNDELYISYIAGGLGASFGHVKKWSASTSTSTWEPLGHSPFTPSVITSTSLAFNTIGQAVNAFQDWAVNSKMSVMKFVTSGVDPTVVDESISVYTNPVKDKDLILNNPLRQQVEEVIIYELSGREVARQKINSSDFTLHVDVSGLGSSTYLFKIEGEKEVVVERAYVE